MTENPLVTIVIPTWNRKALLREAIASVIAQSYQNWELVIPDDGSNDGTVEELRAAGDPRMKVVALNHSGNISSVRNTGAALGSGALIAFLDSDDIWLPRKLESQVAALGGGQARWCYADYEHVDAGCRPMPGRPVVFRPENGRILRQLLLGETVAAIVTVLVERSLFDGLGGFDESMTLRGDFDLALRLAAAADAVALPQVVAMVREHPGRTTAATKHPHEASVLVFDKFLARETEGELRRIARARRSQLLADAGLHRLARRDFAKGAKLLGAAIGGGAGLAYLGRRIAAGLIKRHGRRRDPHKGA